MHALFLTLFHPLRAAEELKSGPRWIAAFLLLSLVSVATRAVVHPYLVRDTVAHLPASATDADKGSVVENLNGELPADLAFLPIRLLTGWCVYSLVLFSACRSFVPAEPVRFRQLFALEVHAEVTSVIAGVVTMIGTVYSAKGLPATTPLSLAGIAHGDHSFIIKSLLTSLNIFTLWYVVLVTAALSVFYKIGPTRAATIVLLAWILSTMVNLGIMQLLRDELHLLL